MGGRGGGRVYVLVKTFVASGQIIVEMNFCGKSIRTTQLYITRDYEFRGRGRVERARDEESVCLSTRGEGGSRGGWSHGISKLLRV